MEHVGSNNEIERSRLEILFGERFFEIENFRLNFRESGQLLHRRRQETGRDVGENIRVQTALESRQELGSETAGTGADFQNSQSPTFGKHARRFPDRGANGSERVTRKQPVSVELFQILRSGARKENLDRVFFAAQNLAQLGTGRCDQQRFWQMTGILLNEIPIQVRRGIGRLSKRFGWAIAAVGFFKKIVSLQLQHQLLEYRSHLRSDVES